MSWKDLRRYWRRVYGFLLPEKAEPCVLVEFYRGPFLQFKNILNSKMNKLDDYKSNSLKTSYFKLKIEKNSRNILEKLKKIKSYGKKNPS